MTTSRLPPLNALRAFEVVARHRSFRKAADELFVTPAAVTHQIKALEEQLEVELFHRLPRGVELTPAATAVLPIFQNAFALMARGVSELRDYNRSPHLTVKTTPTFASRWMMPRLHRFLAIYPDIDVRVLASGNLIRPMERSPDAEDAPQAEPDIDIRFSNGRPESDHVELLFAVDIVPMCHPRLMKQGLHPLKTLADLRHHALLHGDTHVQDRSRSGWAQWLRHAGVTDVDSRRGLQFDHSTLALDAAADGLGVTLATPMFAFDELAHGDLAVAFPLPLRLDRAYYASTAASAANRPEVAAFGRWLQQEAALDARNAQETAQKKKKAAKVIAALRKDPVVGSGGDR